MVTHTHTHTYIHTHTHTYTHDNYYNPRCAHEHRGLIIIDFMGLFKAQVRQPKLLSFLDITSAMDIRSFHATSSKSTGFMSSS